MKEFLINYGIVSLGVLISIILPVVKRYIKPDPNEIRGQTVGAGGKFSEFLTKAKPYLMTGLFSLIVGLLILAFMWNEIQDWRAALLAGYAGDSTLQKLRN